MPTINQDETGIEIFSNKPRHSAAAQEHINKRQDMLKQAFSNARAKRLGVQKPVNQPAKKK